MQQGEPVLFSAPPTIEVLPPRDFEWGLSGYLSVSANEGSTA